MTDVLNRRTLPKLDPGLIFGLAFFIFLLILNLVTNPYTFSAGVFPSTLGYAAPLVLLAFAATPPMLLGNGGIDISIGPVAGLINVFVVIVLISKAGIESPFLIVPFAILAGMLVGLVNGLIVARLRIQPIVVTLGVYLIASGLAIVVAPTPGGSVPSWLAKLAGPASFVLVLVGLVAWFLFRRLPIYEYLMAYGGDERAVYTAGVSVKSVRATAFIVGGFFTGLAGLALSAALGSADPTVGADYTMLGIAAAALGGVSLMGGSGGIVRALIGASSIFLLQNLLTFFNVSSFVLQLTYGLVLVLAVAINGVLSGAFRRKGV